MDNGLRSSYVLEGAGVGYDVAFIEGEDGTLSRERATYRELNSSLFHRGS